MKRFIVLAFGWLLALGTGTALAADLQVGRDYSMIDPPQATSSAGKIEVIEFFSYGCPHCNTLNPLITAWAAKLPKDVVFRRIPVTFNRPAWARLAGIYYGLEATGNLEKLDSAVFAAIHDERVNFNSDEAVATWVASKGLDAKKWTDAVNSFSVQSRLKRIDQEAAGYRITGVPGLAINGRYLVNNTAAENYAALLALTDAVIAKARSENAGK